MSYYKTSRNRCDTKRLNAAGKWIGGRGRSSTWADIGYGTYIRGSLHRAIRRSVKDYTRHFLNLSVNEALDYAESDARENLKTISYNISDTKWRGI